MAQASGILGAQWRAGHSSLAWLIEADAEEEAFRQRRLGTGLAQFVDGRQQQLRHFLAMGVDVFQVAAQHVQRAAQGRQLTIALLAGTGGNVGGLLQHFLGQQLGAGQFDQVQGATHLLQVFHGLLQQAAIVPFGNELLETLFSLFDGGEQFVTHQAQGCRSSDHGSAEPL